MNKIMKETVYPQDHYIDKKFPYNGPIAISEVELSLYNKERLKLQYTKGTPILWEDF